MKRIDLVRSRTYDCIPALCPSNLVCKVKLMKKTIALAIAAAFVASSLGCGSTRARQVNNLKNSLSTYIAQGDAYMRKGLPNYAYNHFTSQIKVYMRYMPELNMETARLYVERGKVALSMRLPAKAEVDFNEARRLVPGITINVSGFQAEVMLPGSNTPPQNPGGNPPPYNPEPQPNPNPQDPPPPSTTRVKVAILDFKEPPETVGKAYGAGFANMMANELSRCAHFIVVERSILDQIMQERNLSQTELLERAQSNTEDKKLLPVKYLIYGNITVEGNSVSVTARLIDWETGLSPVSDYSKRIIGQGASPSFYFDEIARDLCKKLEDGYLRAKR